ncbi:secondary thiamine-phosphate synthase enzyme YjbQ [soil metagenome]
MIFGFTSWNLKEPSKKVKNGLTAKIRFYLASFMQTIKVKSNRREEMIEITSEVEKHLRETKAAEGVCVLFTQHTTCGLTINENADPDVRKDMLLFLKNLIPQYYDGFKHFEHNSDAHIKSSLVGSSVNVPFDSGRLLLGRWQGIYLCEFDGARERKVLMILR